MTPPQSPRANSLEPHRTLPWPGQIPTPFGAAQEELGRRVKVTVKDTEAEGSHKRTHLKETPVPYRQITIDFPVTMQDVNFGFLQGVDEGEEGAEVAKDTSHAPVSHPPQKRNISPSKNPPAKVKRAKGCARALTSSHPQNGISSRTRHQGGGHITTKDTVPGAQMTRNNTQMYEPHAEAGSMRAFGANASVNQVRMSSAEDEATCQFSTQNDFVQPRSRQLFRF